MRREMWDVKGEMWKTKGAAAPDAGRRLRKQRINWSCDSRDEGQDPSGRGEEARRARLRVWGSLDVGRMSRCVRTQGTLERKSGRKERWNASQDARNVGTQVRTQGTLERKSGRTGRRGRRKYITCVRTQRRRIRRRIRFCWWRKTQNSDPQEQFQEDIGPRISLLLAQS